MTWQRRSLSQRQLASLAKKMAKRYDFLSCRDDGKHMKLTNVTTGDLYILPVNHPHRDAPAYAVRALQEKLDEWGVLTKEDFEREV